jgi:hypothetical protein
MRLTSKALAILVLAAVSPQKPAIDRATDWMKQSAEALGGEVRLRSIS